MSDGFTTIPLHAAQNDHEAATAIRSAYLKIERRAAYARSLFGYARIFMILGVILMTLEALLHKMDENRPAFPPYFAARNGSLMPYVLQSVPPPTITGCLGAAGVLFIVQWQMKRLIVELEPGNGTAWTRARGIALTVFVSTLCFPIPLLLCLPVFFLLLNPKTSVVLSPTYAGVVEMTPDITLGSAISNQCRYAWWLMLLILLIGTLMMLSAHSYLR